MKLRHAAFERKHNIQQNSSLLKGIVNSFSIIGKNELSKPYYISYIIPTFLDILDQIIKTPIQEDNVLVFGQNPEWNQRAAILTRDAFVNSGKQAEIITTNRFLSIEGEGKRSADTFYIIIYNAIYLSAEKLSILRDFTSTRILFKLKGVDWKEGGCGVLIQEEAKPILSSLGIDEENAISIGLLASLGAEEFCVATDRNIIKRKLS